jgi:thioredoxin reductase
MRGWVGSSPHQEYYIQYIVLLEDQGTSIDTEEHQMNYTTSISPRYDVAIVGGGPAGLSAAIMLGRARRSVVVIDAGEQRNRSASHVHGLLGHEGKSPADLLDVGREEARSYGVAFVAGEVTSIEKAWNGFTLSGTTGLSARRIIVATGLADDLPDIPGLADQWGSGVVVCPYCDGWEVRDRPLGVIATSPASRNQAHLLRQWSADVTVFGAREAGIPIEQLASFAARGITTAPPATAIRGALGDVIVETEHGAHHVARVFAGARHRPLDELLVSLGCEKAETPVGQFVVTDSSGQTSLAGVWAIGNVADPKALVPISIGAGTAAATQINISLLEEEIADAVSSMPYRTVSSVPYRSV